MTARAWLACALLGGCSVSTLGPPGGAADETTGGGETTTTTDGGDETTGEPPPSCNELAVRTVDVLTTHCAKCHGKGSAAQGGIDYMLDLDELIARDKVTPGAADQSRIVVRMTSESSPMPPPTESLRPDPDDIDAVRAWIDTCTEPGPCAEPTFMPPDELLAQVYLDLATFSADDLPFKRYLSLVHLYNAGWCEPDLEPMRRALAKLVNSLSTGAKIVVPEAIDEQRLILRLDLRDYGWDNALRELREPSTFFPDDPPGKLFSDVWELIADQSPYAIRYTGEQAEALAVQAQTYHAILPADAFLDAAVRAPLYYDILGVPLRSAQMRVDDPPCMDDCLEEQLEISLLANLLVEVGMNEDRVARAGFKASDISDFNRVIERHVFGDTDQRVFWLTHDFSSGSGTKNVEAHPLDFTPDFHAILWSLPNGLQAYLLADEQGQRMREAPANIIQDGSQPDSLVRGAVSCIGCHVAGPISAEDVVRYDLDNGQTEVLFDDPTKDAIRNLYPTRDEFALLLAEDSNRFLGALSAVGVSPDEEEPVMAAFHSFAAELDLSRAAAELGMHVDDLRMNVGKLGVDLAELGVDGGVVTREVFTANFAASVCILGIGITRCCPDGEFDGTCQ